VARARCDDRYLQCRPDRSRAGHAPAELAWTPAWDEVAIRLYTSGSTGAPQAQPKTLGQLVLGARALIARLAEDTEGGVAALSRIVCSVPPQHMFGLECSVMLSLVCGLPVLDRRPLLPADVRIAFEGGPAAVWVATPMHLRSLVQEDEAVPACRLTIASTMPLAPEVALGAERCLGGPVLEIYGSTETGALAMRRTAREADWRPLEGVRLEAGAGRTVAHGPHFASPVAVPDEIAPGPEGRFTLLGRHADLVKIAGRRASLAGLDRLLLDLPGIEDGAFYLPETGRSTERLCLVYAGPPLDRDATLGWLRERLDPVFPAAHLHPRRTAAAKRRRQAPTGGTGPDLRGLAIGAAGLAGASRRRLAGLRRAVLIRRQRPWLPGRRRPSAAAPDSSRSSPGWRGRPGRPFCRALLFPISLYFLVTDPVARGASREFLTAATGRPAGWRDAWANLYTFATTLLDRVYMSSGDFRRFEVSVEGDELVREALEAGKGCVLLGSHLGSFDLLMLKNQVLHNRPITVLMHLDPRSRVRRIAGVDDDKLPIIPLGRFDSYLRAYDVLAKGGLVVALADRSEGAASLSSDFLGRPARSRSGRMRWRRAPGPGAGRLRRPRRRRPLPHRVPRRRRAGARRQSRQGPAGRGRPLRRHARAPCRRYPLNWFNFFPTGRSSAELPCSKTIRSAPSTRSPRRSAWPSRRSRSMPPPALRDRGVLAALGQAGPRGLDLEESSPRPRSRATRAGAARGGARHGPGMAQGRALSPRQVGHFLLTTR
jgi:predicted LPLAT superfamily acyltransferase